MPLDVQSLLSKLGAAPATTGNDDFDFNFNNNVVMFPGADVERALMETTHAGAVDNMTRFEAAGKAIGHFIRMAREGRMTIGDAWQAALDWNQAELSPPWDEDRLRTDFTRLLDEDMRKYGPVAPPSPLQTPVDADWQITDWRADRFEGEAPERMWIVEGLIPEGTAGTFAAVGDAGKSILALKLALMITTAPPVDPQCDAAPLFFGGSVKARGAAVVLTAEDDADEIHRRLNMLDPTFARSNRPLFVIPMLSAGGVKAIVADGPNGPQATPFWYTLKEQLKKIPDLKFIVIDPLSAFVSADSNDNTVGAFVMGLLAELASETRAAIMLVHHVTKSASPTDLRDARIAIKGAGAYVDNGRWAMVLWEAELEDAADILKALGQQKRAGRAGIVYFGGLTKGNAPGEKKLRTLVRGPSGALEDVTDTVQSARPRVVDVARTVHQILVQRFNETNGKFNFPIGRTSLNKFVVPLLVQAGLDLSLADVLPAIQWLLRNGLLVQGGKDGNFEPVDAAVMESEGAG